MGEATDSHELISDLTAALPLLARDAVAAASAAGALPGSEGVALSEHLRAVATDELRDVERIAARIASLGGLVSISVQKIEHADGWREGVEGLIRMQRESLDAVVAAIPADADDAEGEATEHLLEHVASRKREAIELLERALR